MTPVVERVVAALALIVLLPLLLAIGIVVRIDSPGPSLYRATRVGRGGRRFTLFKFRTMIDDGSPGPKVTAGGDRRVTRVGRLLRASKLDELPQLGNVARGEMRLVGWRPEDPAYLDPSIEEQRALFDHQPGLTSPASISYRHEEQLLAAAVADGVDLDEAYRQLVRGKAAEDGEYLARRTGWSDLGVLWRTVGAVRRGGDGPSADGAKCERASGPEHRGNGEVKRANDRRGIAALDEVYRSYDGAYAGRWGWDRPGNVAIAKEREAVAGQLLDVDGPVRRVLDIGAGTGGGFPNLFPDAFRVRLDVLAWRLGVADPPGSGRAAVCADGTALPHPDASVDVVLLSVVLSSVPEAVGRALLAEVGRVVRPGGAVVVYDFRVANPRNRATRRVTRRWVTGALPAFATTSASVTLAPPLARALRDRTAHWYGPLGRLRMTRTHNVIVGRRCAS